MRVWHWADIKNIFLSCLYQLIQPSRHFPQICSECIENFEMRLHNSALRGEPIFLAHAENRLRVRLRYSCFVSIEHALSVNSIKRTARIKNWLFDPNSWTKQNTNTAESIFRITAARCLNYHDRCLCYLPNNIHDKITAFWLVEKAAILMACSAENVIRLQQNKIQCNFNSV